jgi:hypothetical protein
LRRLTETTKMLDRSPVAAPEVIDPLGATNTQGVKRGAHMGPRLDTL